MEKGRFSAVNSFVVIIPIIGHNMSKCSGKAPAFGFTLFAKASHDR